MLFNYFIKDAEVPDPLRLFVTIGRSTPADAVNRMGAQSTEMDIHDAMSGLMAHFSRSEINTLIELRCDAKVMGKLNDQGQLDYVETLKALMEHASQDSRPAVAASLIGTQDEMLLRFEALSSAKGNRRQICLIFLVSLFLILSYFVILQPARLLQNSDFYILYTGEEYFLFEDGSAVSHITQDILGTPPFNTLRIIEGEP